MYPSDKSCVLFKLSRVLKAELLTLASVFMGNYKPGETIALKFLYGFFALIGSIENITVIAAILTNQVLLDVPSNWFVLNLAIGDAVISVASFSRLHSVPTNLILGVFFNFAKHFCAGSLFILTFNRFLSIYDSLKYPNYITLGRGKLLVFTTWAAAVLLVILKALAIATSFEKLFYVSILYYTAITLFTTAMNGYMFKKARDQRRFIKQQRNAVMTGQEESFISEYRLLFRLLIVALTFFASCIPNIIFLYLYPTTDGRLSRPFQRTMAWSHLTILLNAVVDPLLYFINSEEFKRLLNKVKNPVSLRRNAVADLS